jgi:hypothetical protein
VSAMGLVRSPRKPVIPVNRIDAPKPTSQVVAFED